MTTRNLGWLNPARGTFVIEASLSSVAGVLRQELCSDEAQADIDSAVRRSFSAELLGAQETEKQAKDKIESLTREIGKLIQALAEIGISGAITNQRRDQRGKTKIATLMGPTSIEQKKDAYFASYDDVSKRLLVCAAGNVSYEKWLRG